VKTIAKTAEKFTELRVTISNVKWKLSIKDSLNFLSGSIEKLTRTLTSQPGEKKDHLKNTWSFFKEFDLNEEHFELFTQKGIFPYSWLTSYKRLSEESLPPRESFFDELSEKECSESDYEHAQTVWRVFKCQTMADYTLLYNRLDVCLLADIFEFFRDQSMQHYR